MEGEVQLTLLHILNNQCLLPVFRIYCRSNCVDEYLNFWFEVRMLTNKYLHDGAGTRAETSDCSNLFKKYFLPDSIHRIQIDPKIGNELQEELKKQPTIQVFEAAQRYAFDVLDQKMKNFSQSEAYKNFLKRERSLYQKQSERQFDIKEIEMHFKRVNDAHKHLKIISTEIANKLSANAVAVNNLHALAERFTEYSDSIRQADTGNELGSLAECLKKVASIMLRLEVLEKQMNQAISERLETVESSLASDIPNALALKKKMEKASNGDQTMIDTLSTLRDTNNRVDHRTFSVLCEIMEQYLGFFERGYSLMQDILPEVEKYRQTTKATAV
uniref:RGS domain-containing protein n=1 Tax=Vannella robusta TaxID=1487602 RepID=A0A7S4MAY7_9EUKA|mmetsp:Transcript_17107/g.21795  ORF Transcript_17107/g.21795 Transcript_17107/m.21795 type:complete len:330 (+) Transcript_17107:127-1116(+)